MYTVTAFIKAGNKTYKSKFATAATNSKISSLAGTPAQILQHARLDFEDSKQEAKSGPGAQVEDMEEEQETSLMEEEEKETGVVKLAVYKEYWRAVGMCLSPLVLVSLFLMQGTETVHRNV